MASRLPAHVEVSGLVRAVTAAGGFATVIKKGERDAGTLLVICCENGTNGRIFERMPQPDGTRKWTLSREEDTDNPTDFVAYYNRRGSQDDDLWIIELDVSHSEKFLNAGDG